jgi:putative spermidine/putrescine transport system substrate-binding protein
LSNQQLRDAMTSKRIKVDRRKFLKGATATTLALSGCTGNESENPSNTSGGETNSDNVDGGTTVGDVDPAQELSNTLNIATFGGSYGEKIKEHLIDTFAEQTGVNAKQRVVSDTWELIQKQKAGREDTSIDVIILDTTTTFTAVDSELLYPIREDNCPNLGNLVDKFNPYESAFDPGSDAAHTAVMQYGGDGYTYRTNHDLGDMTSWTDLEQEPLQGKVTLQPTMQRLVGGAAHRLGYSVPELQENHDEIIPEVWDHVTMMNNDYIHSWPEAAQLQQLLANDTVHAGQFFVGRTYVLRNESDVPVEYIVPEEGAPMWASGWGVAQGISDKRRYTAERFINHVLTEETLTGLVQAIPYAPGIEFSDPPEILQHSDYQNLDRLHLWDPVFLDEHRSDWLNKWQQLIRQ